MGLWAKAQALGFGLALFFASFYGAIVCGGWTMTILFIRPGLYRRIFDKCIGAWEWLAVALLEKWLGLRVVVTGDRFRSGEQSLIVMNHRTCLDWLYFWAVLARQSGVSTQKIILKSPLKRIPGAGWAMQAAAFMFLKRKWEDDEQYLENMIDYFRGINYKTQILLFPEGTDFNPRTKKRSDEYAAKNHVQPYKHVLHPRTTGFSHVVSLINDKWKGNAAVYDVTIAYSSPSPQTERDLLAGQFPGTVHFHVRRHELAELLPNSDEWCQSRWAEKEARLEDFQSKSSFSLDLSTDKKSELTAPGLSKNLENISLGGSDILSHSSTGTSKNGSSKDKEITVWLYVAMISWAVFILSFTWALVVCWIVRWLAAAHVAAFIYFDRRWGGFELFQAWVAGARSAKQVKSEKKE